MCSIDKRKTRPTGLQTIKEHGDGGVPWRIVAEQMTTTGDSEVERCRDDGQKQSELFFRLNRRMKLLLSRETNAPRLPVVKVCHRTVTARS